MIPIFNLTLEAPISSEVLALFILFNLKHFLGDFVLQSSYMVFGKGKEGWGFIKPLSLHCLVHATLSAAIIACIDVKFLWLASLEFVVHFIIDRLKSGPRYGGQFSMSDAPKMFWVLFGLDQFLHQLTYIGLIFLMTMRWP